MAVNANLISVLEKSVSGDKGELEAAKLFIEEAAKSNFLELLKQFSDILSSVQCSAACRMQAGLQLKNAVYSKDSQIRSSYQQRWIQIPADARNYIKQNCLKSIGTEATMHSSAAQCVAYIACAEFPAGEWPDLMQILVQNVTDPTSTENCKHGTLEAIGYICQDIEPSILASQSNVILTAIVCGMKKEEPSDYVRVAATQALLNSLEFTKHNFDVENERNYIMQVVCEATQSTVMQVKVAALQCLVKIMSLYYKYMETYMGQALFAITLESIKDETPEISLQGIEFWSTVCDEEIDLAIDALESVESGQPPQASSMFYAKGALKFVVPLLMQILTNQSETVDDDEWNPCKAAGVCLMLMAQCCEDSIVPLVIPFVTENIQQSDWHLRDAAVMSFGSILEGPDPNSLKPLVESAMPCIIGLLQDQSSAVRDTVAWTIGRVCETLPEIALQESYLVQLLNGLVSGLSAEPRVASNICWALSSLADSAYDVATGEHGEENGDPPRYALSQYFNTICEQLLVASGRSDGGQHNLRNASYSALMALLRSAAEDCYSNVLTVTVAVLDRFDTVLAAEAQVGDQDRTQFDDLLSLLCGTLQAVLRKLHKEDAPHISDRIMTTLMALFKSTSRAIAQGAGDQAILDGEGGSKSADGVQEDALLAISALVDKLGDGFMKYTDAFMPILLYCLRNHREIEVCNNAVGLLGDMCRGLHKHLIPHCGQLFSILLEVLQDPVADKTIQSAVLSTFGDFALALDADFLPFLPHVLNTLKLASEVQVSVNDPEVMEYLNTLRSSCLDAYAGIIQGLKSELSHNNEALEFLGSHIPHVLSFIGRINADEKTTDELLASACGLVGDIATSFGPTVGGLLEMKPVADLLQRGRRAKLPRTKQTAAWATKEVRKFKAPANSLDQSLRSGLGASTVQSG